MIKYLIAGALFVASFAACNMSSQKGSISGKIDGAGGKTIYLESFVNNRQVFIDSSVVGADGSFAIVPSRPLEMNFYRLVLDEEHVIMLITDSTESPKFSADFSSMESTLTVDGSANTETLRDLEVSCEPYNKKERAAKEKYMSSGISPENKMQLNQEVMDSRKQRSDFIKKWLDTHSSTPAALVAVQQLDPRTDIALFNKVFADLEKSFGHTVVYKGMKQQVQNLMKKEKAQAQSEPQNSKISVGNPAPEIALPDTKGTVRKLSSLKGKTVLIDFWASWCGPCRRENPNVVTAYNKYNKDGFEVFSVSLDKAKEPWLKAIQDDKLIWPNHVSDLQYWQSAGAATYGVTSIPFTVLVDKEGKILGHNLRGAMLEEKLKAIYGH